MKHLFLCLLLGATTAYGSIRIFDSDDTAVGHFYNMKCASHLDCSASGGKVVVSLIPDTGTSGSRIEQVARVALDNAPAQGGVASWANPVSGTIIISKLIVDLTTKSTTTGDTIDCGVAADGDTTDDDLVDGGDVGSVATLNSATNAGTNGSLARQAASGEYVTCSASSGTAAGLAGFAYIHYYED